MRKLRTDDVFVALRLSKKLKLKEEMQKLAANVKETSASVNEAGVEVIVRIIDFVSDKNAEEAFYEFLARPFECTVEDVAGMDLTTLVENIETLAKENDL